MDFVHHFSTSYGILGSYIALNYRIIFDDRIPWDAYFSFDNRSIVMTGGGLRDIRFLIISLILSENLHFGFRMVKE